MKTEDLQTTEQIKAAMSEAAADQTRAAAADSEALARDDDSAVADLEASAHADIVAAEPTIANALPVDRYSALDERALDVGETRYEIDFNEARRSLMGGVASGVDGFVAVVLQEAVDTIDEIRSVTEELSVEAAQLSAAAASGVLVPATREDLEDFQDELGEAKSQATMVQREIGNLQARRLASRVAAGTDDQPDEFPIARSLPSRSLVITPAASEPEDREDQGASLAQGTAGQTRASVASDQATRLQELLRAPAMDRINYIVICAAIANMSRSKKARDKAAVAIEKLKRIYASLRNIMSGSFVNDLQSNLEAQAAQSISRTLDFIQSKLDAVDGFLKVATGLPGPFVTTVNAIGDVPDTTPVINSLASLCGLKGAKFCDLKGMLEVAKSLDTEFGLQVPKLPMIGRAVLLLDPPSSSQSPDPVVVPGQEADLLLVSASAAQRLLVARFSRADAPVIYDVVSASYIERANVFGTGGGELTILGNGTGVDVTVSYDSVSFSAVTGNYTFTLTPSFSFPFSTLIPSMRGEADAMVLAGSWTDATAFPVGSSVITLRVPEAQARDITMPCNLALGFGEQSAVSGQYDASVANTVRALSPSFEAWMVGLPIELGAATANGVATSRTIATFVDAQTVTYSGATVAATLPGSRGTFRISIDKFEVRRAQSMSNGAHPDLKVFALQTVTTRPHGRQRVIPQTSVRVVPTARDTFVDAVASPADPDVRDEDFLPVGSTEVLATYEDAAQDLIFTPILTAQGTGKLFIDGQGPFDFIAVSDQPGAQLRFTLAAGTPSVFDAGVVVEVETTSLLDRFAIDFPDTWFAPFDQWLLGLGVELGRLEGKFCRLLSGSSQDVAASAAALTVFSTTLTLQLTAARFLLMAWLVPLVQKNSVTRALEKMEAIGAQRAVRQVREGRLSEFASMQPAEGTDAGAAMVASQAYQTRVTTEEQEKILAKNVAELRGRFESTVAAANAVGDIESAQQAEIERRREGARKIEALQEKLQ